jgi:hypothetical protein
LVVKLTFEVGLRASRAIFFIDNDSVREALIKGNSGALASHELLLACSLVEARLGSLPWFARVPSPSNLADGPSRLNFELVAALPGAARFDPVLPEWWPV